MFEINHEGGVGPAIDGRPRALLARRAGRGERWAHRNGPAPGFMLMPRAGMAAWFSCCTRSTSRVSAATGADATRAASRVMPKRRVMARTRARRCWSRLRGPARRCHAIPGRGNEEGRTWRPRRDNPAASPALARLEARVGLADHEDLAAAADDLAVAVAWPSPTPQGGRDLHDGISAGMWMGKRSRAF